MDLELYQRTQKNSKYTYIRRISLYMIIKIQIM